MSAGELRVVLLTNIIPPSRKSFIERLAFLLPGLRVLLSAESEPNRSWEVPTVRADVVVQRTFSFRRRLAHPAGFTEDTYLHVPYDTLSRLWRFRPDVVVASEFGARTLQSLVYRQLMRRSRLVVWATLSERSEAGRGAVRRAIRRLILRGADAVVVNGQSGRRYVESLGFTSVERILIAPYATDAPAGALTRCSETRTRVTRIGAIGQLIERKGLPGFVRALDEWCVDHPGRAVTLEIVGGGEGRAALESAQRASDLDVIFRGELTREEVHSFLLGVDALAFPTLSDEWGMVVNEAMLAGCPVLGSVHSQAVDELVAEGKTGWRFDPCVEGSTRSAIDRAMAASAEELRQMASNCHDAIASVSTDVIAGRVASFLTSMR